MRHAWREMALALLLTSGLAASPARAQWGYGAGFRGYVGPNLYEPGFYTAYGYAPPVYSLYARPRFDLGSPSGNPGYSSGSPYDYRGYNGAFDYNYPASYPGFGGPYSYGNGPGYVGGAAGPPGLVAPVGSAAAPGQTFRPKVLRDFGRQPRPTAGATGRIPVFRGPPATNATPANAGNAR